MPIIDCPECTGKISSTVKQCIHCGAPISVCPECGKIHAKRLRFCPECGFAFETEKDAERSSADAGEAPNADRHFSAGEIHQYWMRESFLAKFTETNAWKILRGIILAIEIIVSIGYFIAFDSIPSTIKSAINKSNLESLADLDSEIKALAFWSCFLDFIYFVLPALQKHLKIYDFKLWFNNRKHCGANVIKRTLSLDFEKIPNDELMRENKVLQTVLDAEIYQKNLPKRNAGIFALACSIASNLFTNIILYRMFIYAYETCYRTFFTAIESHARKASYSFIDDALPGYWKENSALLVITGIAVALNVLISIWHSSEMNRAKQDWISKNAPDKAEVYKKYFKNIDNYLIDRKFSKY